MLDGVYNAKALKGKGKTKLVSDVAESALKTVYKPKDLSGYGTGGTPRRLSILPPSTKYASKPPAGAGRVGVDLGSFAEGLIVDELIQSTKVESLSELLEDPIERLIQLITGQDVELDFPGGVSGSRLYGTAPNRATSTRTKREFRGTIAVTQGPNAGKLVTAHERAAYSDGKSAGYAQCTGWFKSKVLPNLYEKIKRYEMMLMMGGRGSAVAIG